MRRLGPIIVTLLVGCGDIALPPQVTECQMTDTKCLGDKLVTCVQDFNESRRWSSPTPCPVGHTCSNGACVSECVCNTPPANTCKDATTLTIYSPVGLCSQGACTYPSTAIACPLGCDADRGGCTTDLCDTLTCTSPPSSCYLSPGTCVDGKCDYTPDNGKSCDDADSCTTSDICTAGSCHGSAVVCNTPPASICKDADTVTIYTAPGVCSAGLCAYGSADMTCPFGCDLPNNVCKGDPCSTITCDAPPDSQCYTVPGICSNGSCIYLPKSGVTCDDGDLCTKLDTCSSSGVCAGTTFTCNDNLTCTTNTCDGKGGCTYPLKSNYCLLTISGVKTCYASGAHNPTNACEYCSVSSSTSRWSASGGTPQVTWAFDTGTLQGFTVTPSPATSTSVWQVDSYRSVSPAYSLYFGNVATRVYDDPSKIVSGQVTSPAVTLPSGAGKLCLKFQLYKDTEGYTWDYVWITVQPAGTIIWDSTKEPNYGLTNKVFIPIAVDVTSLAGQSVQFMFSFDSKDSAANNYEGVYLDDLQVLSNCTP